MAFHSITHFGTVHLNAVLFLIYKEKDNEHTKGVSLCNSEVRVARARLGKGGGASD